jgi:hypothetical protein
MCRRRLIIDASTSAVSLPLPRLRGRAGVGVPPQNALFEWIVRSPTRRFARRSPPQAGEVTRARACADSIFKQPRRKRFETIAIAVAPRNDRSHSSAISQREALELYRQLAAPSEKRAWGMPGAQCTRSLACEV